MASVSYDPYHGLNFEQSVIRCQTYTQGKGDVWLVTEGGDLRHLRPNYRFSCSLAGWPLFVRSTCMKVTGQCSSGYLIVFKKNSSCELWHLGVVHGMFYQRKSIVPQDVAHVYQWNGDLRMFECTDSKTLLGFFNLVSLDLDSIEMFFFNHVGTKVC